MPVPRNANTATNFGWINYLPFSKDNIATAEDQLKEEAWRPPRQEEISHAMGISSLSEVNNRRTVQNGRYRFARIMDQSNDASSGS